MTSYNEIFEKNQKWIEDKTDTDSPGRINDLAIDFENVLKNIKNIYRLVKNSTPNTVDQKTLTTDH